MEKIFCEICNPILVVFILHRIDFFEIFCKACRIKRKKSLTWHDWWISFNKDCKWPHVDSIVLHWLCRGEQSGHWPPLTTDAEDCRGVRSAESLTDCLSVSRLLRGYTLGPLSPHSCYSLSDQVIVNLQLEVLVNIWNYSFEQWLGWSANKKLVSGYIMLKALKIMFFFSEKRQMMLRL